MQEQQYNEQLVEKGGTRLEQVTSISFHSGSLPLMPIGECTGNRRRPFPVATPCDVGIRIVLVAQLVKRRLDGRVPSHDGAL